MRRKQIMKPITMDSQIKWQTIFQHYQGTGTSKTSCVQKIFLQNIYSSQVLVYIRITPLNRIDHASSSLQSEL